VIVRLLQSTFLILCCLCVHSFALAQVKPLPIPAPPALAAKSYLLLDYDTGTIITEKNADEKLEPASLTKLMTAYIVSFQLKHGGLSPDDKVFVSRNAHKTKGSRTFLEPESMVSIRDLMFGMVVQSGNDASVALAEHIGGSEEGFASMMNEMASRLGMDNTHYENSTGLPAPNHLTTARDLAKLARALIRDHPSLYKLYSVKEFTYNNIKQKNRNTLLLRDPSVDGMKTGHTEAAGYCLVASAKRGDMRLISILLGARNEPGQAEALERDYRVTSSLVAPIAKGQKLGMVSFRLDDQILAELPLVALEPIEKGSLFRRASDSIKRMLK